MDCFPAAVKRKHQKKGEGSSGTESDTSNGTYMTSLYILIVTRIIAM